MFIKNKGRYSVNRFIAITSHPDTAEI